MTTAAPVRPRSRGGLAAAWSIGALAVLAAAWTDQGCAQVIDPLEASRRIAQAGARDLALVRVDALQPRDPSGPRWADWEVLRYSLLASLGRHGDIAARAERLSGSGMAPEAERALRLHAARAATLAADGASARRHLLRVLWQLRPGADEAREARLLVIDSLIADRSGEEAFRAMLRYQLDYAPLDRAVAARFVDGLLSVGLAKDAVNWLALVDDNHPAGMRLRLATGVADPAAVVASARSQIAKGGGPEFWSVLREAGIAQKNPVLLVEALEQLVQAAAEAREAGATARLAELRGAYQAAAQATANQSQLLTGDDAGWFDRASRLLGPEPVAARALFGYLAQQARTESTRHSSQLQLVFSLEQSKLGLVALRLFDDAGRVPVATVDPQARFVLGGVASAAGLDDSAARLWAGLPPPPGTGAGEWALRVAGAHYRAGQLEQGTTRARAVFGERERPGPELVAQGVALGVGLLEGGRHQGAEAVLGMVLPYLAGTQRRDALLALGRAAEQRPDARAAADHFLQAATLLDDRAVDAVAVGARMSAAASLARAGLRDDARALYQWLLRNIKDPAHLDAVRREMRRL